jgi:glycosyltransferase involved in cell wall biosynthesis
MRILFAAHQFFPEHYAGVETLTLGIARELKSRGHEPHVFAAKRSFPTHDLEPGETEDYEHDGIPVRCVGRPRKDLSLHYDRLDHENETMAERAREYMREVEPDIIHAMHFQGLSASVIPAFKELGVPLVYTATDFWSICPVVDLRRHDGIMCRGPDLAHCPRCIMSRVVMSRPPMRRDPGFQRMNSFLERTPDVALRISGRLSGTSLFNYSRPLFRIHALKGDSEYMKGAVELLDHVGPLKERPRYIREATELLDHIIAPTALIRDLLISNGIGTEKIQVSHYGIDTSDISSAPRNRSLPPPLRIGFIGTLAQHKGCDILIRAFKSLPPELDATLTVYGNLERFKHFVKELRTLAGEDERITFAGTFSQEKVGQVLSEIDVLVVPSRWYENAPLVVYQAFAAGVPVVATNLGGLSESINHEENGLLFELENANDLARQLGRLLEEPELLERLRAGIGLVKTVEENVDELERLYISLAKDRTGI